MRQLNPIYIKWRDSLPETLKWLSCKEIQKNSKPFIVESVGYLIHETDEFYIIGQNITEQIGLQDEQFTCGLINIPKASIIESWYLYLAFDKIKDNKNEPNES